jgi:hypothetical protein
VSQEGMCLPTVLTIQRQGVVDNHKGFAMAVFFADITRPGVSLCVCQGLFAQCPCN